MNLERGPDLVALLDHQLVDERLRDRLPNWLRRVLSRGRELVAEHFDVVDRRQRAPGRLIEHRHQDIAASP